MEYSPLRGFPSLKERSINMARGSEEAYNEGQRVPDHCQQLDNEAKQRQDQAAQLHMDTKNISSASQLVYIESILEPAVSPGWRAQTLLGDYASMVECLLALSVGTQEFKAARTSHNAMKQEKGAP